MALKYSIEPFYKTLADRKITEYRLAKYHHISTSTLHRLKNGQPVTTETILHLCEILHCDISDIICVANQDDDSLEE